MNRFIRKTLLLLTASTALTTAAAQDEIYTLETPDSTVVDVASEDSLAEDTLFIDTLPTLVADSALSDSARAAQAEALARWRTQISEQMTDRLRDELFESTQVAAVVWDLTDDRLLYSRNGRQRMRPASTQKVITAVSALDILGTDYQFSTHLYCTGEQPDSSRTLRGRLYLVGGMDPYLDETDLCAMADSVRAQGIDTILGGIVCDLTFRDTRRMGAGWCWDDDDSNPSLSPLTVRGSGSPASRLRTALRSRGIVVQGSSSEGEKTREARLLCTRHRPLATVMRPMLKNSNNRCAESVFYQLAHHEGGKGASARSAARAVARTLRHADLNPDHYDVADGSGLSLYNYVTADMEVKLLRYAYQHRDIFNALYPLLPVAGRDGTLRRRMRGTCAQGNVHAKTGTVTGIRSLAGYCTAANGHLLAFALINQGLTDDTAPARHWQDRVCRLLCE